MSAIRHTILGPAVLVACVLLIGSSAWAQRGGGGRGGGGGGAMPVASSQGRLDTMEASFTLTKDQKKTIKTIMDDAHKSAAPVREGLLKTHAAIAAAVQAGKGQAEIDQAVKDYAAQASAMTTIEMKTLALVLKTLDKDQMAKSAAVSSTFFMMRGAFLDNKKWDDIPDGKLY